MKKINLDELTREDLIEVIASMNNVYRTHQIHIIKDYLTEEHYKKTLESDVVKRNLEIGGLCWQYHVDTDLEKIKKYNENKLINFSKNLLDNQESIDSEIGKVISEDFFEMLDESVQNNKDTLSNDKYIDDDFNNIEQRAKNFALDRCLQSNHKYDEKSCIEGYIEGVTEDKWMDVKYELPEEDVSVLVYIQKFSKGIGYIRIGWFDSVDKNWWIMCEQGEECFEKSMSYKIDSNEITKWMSIDLPKNK